MQVKEILRVKGNRLISAEPGSRAVDAADSSSPRFSRFGIEVSPVPTEVVAVTTFRFVKGHGTENDFVLLPDPDGTADSFHMALSDTAVGCDGPSMAVYVWQQDMEPEFPLAVLEYTVRGAVTDALQAVIPTAKVTLTNTATGVAINRVVTATFSKAMDPATLTANFKLAGPGAAPVRLRREVEHRFPQEDVDRRERQDAVPHADRDGEHGRRETAHKIAAQLAQQGVPAVGRRVRRGCRCGRRAAGGGRPRSSGATCPSGSSTWPWACSSSTFPSEAR